MNTETKTDTPAPKTQAGGGAPPCWPPLAHIVNYLGDVAPGSRALCGAKLMGISLGPMDSAQPKRCQKCIEIHQRWGR